MTKRKVMAVASADRQSFTLRVGQWRGTFPIGKLPDWIRAYEGLRDRRGGQYACHYAEAVEKMKALQERVSG